jgi:hypothetical protein
VRLRVLPPGEDYGQQLKSGQVDLAVAPREVFIDYQDFPHQLLFTDRLLCVVDKGCS